jgi:hypothetical protein
MQGPSYAPAGPNGLINTPQNARLAHGGAERGDERNNRVRGL